MYSYLALNKTLFNIKTYIKSKYYKTMVYQNMKRKISSFKCTIFKKIAVYYIQNMEYYNHKNSGKHI